MDFPDYVQSISFRFARPDLPGSAAIGAAAALLGRLGLRLDRWNTRLPCENAQMRHRLRPIRRSGPDGPFAVAVIINRAVWQLPRGEAFVALGIGNGFPLLAAVSGNPEKRCIGVDPFAGDGDFDNERRSADFRRCFGSLRTSQHDFHERDYRACFAEFHDTPIGVCFIGGGPDDPLERLRTSEPYLAENAFVILEGANERTVRDAGLAFLRSSRNQYRVLLDRCAPHHGELTFGSGILLFQLLGRNAAVDRCVTKPVSAPATLVPAA